MIEQVTLYAIKTPQGWATPNHRDTNRIQNAQFYGRIGTAKIRSEVKYGQGKIVPIKATLEY